jgi:hypothetical protein
MKKYKVKISIPFYGKDATLQTDSDGYCHYYSMSFKPSGYPDLFEEIKEPLFVTEDGFEVFDTNRVFYGVYKSIVKRGIERKIIEFEKPINEDWDCEDFMIFSHKANAEKWIKENKPKFSEKQILDAIHRCQTNRYNLMFTKDELLKELGL